MFQINKKSIIFLAAGFFTVAGLIWWWAENNMEVEEKVQKGILQIEVDIGPFCPVEQPGIPCSVPKEAYTSRQVTVFKSDDKTIANQKYLDENGNFSAEFSPGDYQILISPGGIGLAPRQDVTIISGQITKLNIDIDTGIR